MQDQPLPDGLVDPQAQDTALRTAAAQGIALVGQQFNQVPELFAQALMVNLFVLLNQAPANIRNAWATRFSQDLAELVEPEQAIDVYRHADCIFSRCSYPSECKKIDACANAPKRA